MKIGLKRLVGATAFALLTVAVAGCDSQHSADTTHGKLGSTVNADLMQTLNTVSRQSLARKLEPAAVSLQPVSGPTLGSAKPVVLYIGADFCPYCAALRWPLVVALLRFGNFDGLRYMRSSSNDVYPNTVTFSFHGAQYHSDYLQFEAVDLADRSGQPLSRPSDAQQTIFQQFDAAPYTRTPGAIPFLYLGGRYIEIGAPISTAALSSLSWQNVARQLRAGQSALSNQIISAANVYSAAVCDLTGGKPANVCNSPAIEAARNKLPDK